MAFDEGTNADKWSIFKYGAKFAMKRTAIPDTWDGEIAQLLKARLTTKIPDTQIKLCFTACSKLTSRVFLWQVENLETHMFWFSKKLRAMYDDLMLWGLCP